jgi:hypothetical protein
VVCHNPDTATRAAAVRATLVDRLDAMIAGSDRLSPTKRAELRGVIATKPDPNRLITADAKLDGKYLLRTCDPHLSTEDLALGYQQPLRSSAAGET